MSQSSVRSGSLIRRQLPSLLPFPTDSLGQLCQRRSQNMLLFLTTWKSQHPGFMKWYSTFSGFIRKIQSFIIEKELVTIINIQCFRFGRKWFYLPEQNSVLFSWRREKPSNQERGSAFSFRSLPHPNSNICETNKVTNSVFARNGPSTWHLCNVTDWAVLFRQLLIFFKTYHILFIFIIIPQCC